MDRRRLGAAVALAFDGSEEASLLLLQSMRGSMRLLQSMRGLMRLYDGLEEAVALLGVALAFTRGTVNQL
jgi:threonine/homoserine efflux transporter RhtA